MGPCCNEQHCCNNDHRHTVLDELVCHFPYAVLSLAVGLITLSVLTTLYTGSAQCAQLAYYRLFHSFHFMHIVFAAAGTVCAYLRYSKSWLKAFVVGLIVPAIFCVLSDVILPYVGGRMLGVPMRFHLCFLCEFTSISIFLLVGVLTGFALKLHVTSAPQGSLFNYWLHFGHIVLSSLAALFYLVSHGFCCWDEYMGIVYALLIIAVVILCTMSDVVVPILVAKMDKHT
jgi:hypothetical protein